MPNYTKSCKRQLRHLSGLAYQRALDAALSKLNEKFDLWKNKTIDAFELSDHIHKFHDGISRDLYKFYVLPNDHVLQVAHACNNNILSKEEISTEVYEAIFLLLEEEVEE